MCEYYLDQALDALQELALRKSLPSASDVHSDKPLDEEDLEKQGSGVMVGFFLPSDLAKDLALDQKSAERPEELHLTVLYLGKELTEEEVEAVKEMVKRCGKRYAPLQGTVGGAGRFPATPSSDNKDVLVRLVDLPRLELLREHLIQKLRSNGIEPVLNHGYTPHITLAYVEPDYEGGCQHAAEQLLAVNQLTVAVGGLHFDYPLNGEEVLKSTPTASDVHSDKPIGEEEEEVVGDLSREFVGKAQDFEIDIISKSKKKQLVFGWFKLATKKGKPVTDRQGDLVTDDDLEEAAYNYVLESRDGGEMHKRTGVAKLIESIAFTKEKQEALGIDLGKTGWFGGFKITDKGVWDKVEKGEYSMFSIHGKGQRKKIEE